MTYSIQNVRLEPREEITGFQVEVSGVGFESVSSLPKGWRITIDNKSLTQTRLSADLAFGSETMSSAEVQKIIFKFADAALDTLPFSIIGHLVVTDYARERNVSLSRAHFVRAE